MTKILPRLIREKQEESLSDYAMKSKDTRGRARPVIPCSVRTEYERDVGKILYSMEFRRLRHKTQVFFNPKNDHICTRMEHVLHVNYIAHTIGRSLNLNPDLINAIALGHDLGHPPFGHAGEKMLDICLRKIDPTLSFRHENHSLRVADRLSVRKDRPGEFGYNLTFEVRDGIASHCGETYDELRLVPFRQKTEKDLVASPNKTNRRRRMPATLEGCVVRFADKIAYVGRDIEDAVRAGIMEFDDLPIHIQSELGQTNGQIINTLVTDIVERSIGKDEICLGKDKGEALHKLLLENVERIYQSEKIRSYEKMAQNIVEGLFEALMIAGKDPEKLMRSEVKVLSQFYGYVCERGYLPDEPCQTMVADFIAGMTDSYAQKCYEEIYWF
jgi:dGTPase